MVDWILFVLVGVLWVIGCFYLVSIYNGNYQGHRSFVLVLVLQWAAIVIWPLWWPWLWVFTKLKELFQ